MYAALPDEIEKTHVPVAQYRVGPYWFFSAMPKGVLVSDVKTFAWWASYAGDWVRRESFDSLDDAMEAAVNFARNKKKQ